MKVIVAAWIFFGYVSALMRLQADAEVKFRIPTRYWVIVLLGPVATLSIRGQAWQRLWNWIERGPRTANGSDGSPKPSPDGQK